MTEQFLITAKKKFSIKPFLQVFEARRQQDSKNHYLVEIYNLTKLENEKIEQSLEYNQSIFTDDFEFPTFNLLKIIKIEKSEYVAAHFVQKYDKTLEDYIKSRKKGRVSQQMCLLIMEDILKGLATILQAGYRPVAIRADNVVRCFSRNPEERQQVWKLKNVVYSSSFSFQHQNFLTYEERFCPPQIYSRRNAKDIEYEESQEYTNALLVWSLGIIMAKLLGVENRLDSKKKLSLFRDRQFNILDILYIRKQYSEQFLKMVSSMLHFSNKKRMSLRSVFDQPLFSAQLREGLRKSEIVKVEQEKQQQEEKQFTVECSLFQFVRLF